MSWHGLAGRAFDAADINRSAAWFIFFIFFIFCGYSALVRFGRSVQSFGRGACAFTLQISSRLTPTATPPSFVVPRPSPVCVVELARALQRFPDRFFDYILSGFRVRFRVGFDYSSARLSQARRNLSSAREHAAVVDSYIALESLHHRRLCGPIRGRPSAWESTSARLA